MHIETGQQFMRELRARLIIHPALRCAALEQIFRIAGVDAIDALRLAEIAFFRRGDDVALAIVYRKQATIAHAGYWLEFDRFCHALYDTTGIGHLIVRGDDLFVVVDRQNGRWYRYSVPVEGV